MQLHNYILNRYRLMAVLVLSLIFALNTFSQVQVEAYLDSVEMFVGHQVHLTMDVVLPENKQAVFQDFEPRHEIVPGVEVLEHIDKKEKYIDNYLKRVSRQYTLTSFEDTLYLIPIPKVTVDGKEYNLPSIALKVMTLSNDSIDFDKYFPPKTIQKNPFNVYEWIFVIILALIASLLFMKLLKKWKRYKNKPAAIVLEVPQQKADDSAFNEIEEIKNSYYQKQISSKDYYTKITLIIRQFIKNRFNIDALEMTSEQIIDAITTKITTNEADKKQREIDELRTLFATADLTKFAKYDPTIDETQRDILRIEEFIRSNTIEQEENKPAVSSLNTNEKPKTDKRQIIVLVILSLITALIIIFTMWRIISLIE